MTALSLVSPQSLYPLPRTHSVQFFKQNNIATPDAHLVHAVVFYSPHTLRSRRVQLFLDIPALNSAAMFEVDGADTRHICERSATETIPLVWSVAK